MKNPATLQITTPNDRDIVMTRVFDAPRRLVFEAHTKPALVRQWLSGLEGWTMPVCEIDLRVGGRYRYVWRKEKTGEEMSMGGVYREVVAPERIVATEKFDPAWYAGEAVDTFVFAEKGGRTTLTQTVRYESKEARDTALESSVDGVAASFDRLEKILETMPRA
jgi:uncharacterized protein YndB with AHSA1/START domain